MVTFGEVLAFDPEQITEIFNICDARQKTCSTLSTHLKTLDSLHTWKGDASDAARHAAGRKRVDIDAHGNESWKIAAAARDCYNEGTALSREAKATQDAATAAGLHIDPQSGKVTDPTPPDQSHWTSAEKTAYQKTINDLQTRVNNVLSRAERFDDNLAAAINTADGSMPSTPEGEGANVNQAARQANQVAAFRATYGRDPTSENDWRIAETLDPHSYDPKNKGVRPNVSVLKINPVPGQGVVSTGLFIPGEKVLGGTQRHLGDNRGFDPQFDAEDTRVTYVVDSENGYVIARQNPSVTSTGKVRVGTPEVKAAQLADGTVAIDYKAADPFAPTVAAETAWSVNGHTIITPGPDGARISGNTTDYPSMETYQYTPDGQTRTLYRDDAGDHTEFGPLANLPLHHDFGAYDDDFARFPEDVRSISPRTGLPIPTGDVADTTELGDPKAPPHVKVPR